MENKTLTAVEWLIKQIEHIDYDEKAFDEISDIYKKALALEREQMVEAYIKSYETYCYSDEPNPTEDAELYYTTKYGKQ